MIQEFVQAVNDAIDRKIANIHTAVPGKIVSYDADKGVAAVLPMMKFKKPDGTMIDYPQISGVPMVLPQALGQDAIIAYPIKSGDGCLLIFAEQSIDYWMYGQQTETDLKFDLTNAICIPGLFSKVNGVIKEACANNSIIIDVKGTRISVKDGEVSIKASSVTINGDLKVTGKVETGEK